MELSIDKNNTSNLNQLNALPKIQNSQIKAKFIQEELIILEKIYDNLANRSETQLLKKDDFLKFFNCTGLLGQKLFHSFCSQGAQFISYEEFLQGIAKFVKCNREDQTKQLFEFFDIDNKGSINMDQFRTMLQNYPKSSLKLVLDDIEFLNAENLLKYCGIKQPGSPKKQQAHVNGKAPALTIEIDKKNQNVQSKTQNKEIESDLPDKITHLQKRHSVEVKDQILGTKEEFAEIGHLEHQIRHYSSGDLIEKAEAVQDNAEDLLSRSSNDGEIVQEEFAIDVDCTVPEEVDGEEGRVVVGDNIDDPIQIKKKSINQIMQNYVSFKKNRKEQLNANEFQLQPSCETNLNVKQMKELNVKQIKELNDEVDSNGHEINSPRMRKRYNSTLQTEGAQKRLSLRRNQAIIDENLQNAQSLDNQSLSQHRPHLRHQMSLKEHGKVGATSYSGSDKALVQGSEKIDDVNFLLPSKTFLDIDDRISQGTQIMVNFKDKQYNLKNANLSALLSKFIAYVFRVYDIGKTGHLDFKSFRLWITQHPILLNMFSNTFHEEIWGFDSVKLAHKHLNIKAKRQGYLWRKMSQNSNRMSRFWYQIKQKYLFCLEDEHSKQFKDIFCLDGLQANELSDFEITHLFGFQIQHPCKYYQCTAFYCESLKEQMDWISQIKNFSKFSPDEDYIKKGILGKGGFSTVFRCEHKTTHQEYAMKIIEKIKLSTEESMAIENETEVMKFLNHPGIIKFHELIETKTSLYIINELVTGGDLMKYMQDHDRLSEPEAYKIMMNLIETLQYIHSTGIVHRDIKPENVLLVFDNSDPPKFKQIKIIDFGLATFLHKQESDACEYGTYGYVAPEILKSQPASFASDTFSLGVIFYTMLSGKLPFDSVLPQQIVQNTLQGKYKLKGKKWDQVSDNAKDLITRMLCLDPEKRITLKQCLKHPWIKYYSERNTTIQNLIHQQKEIDQGIHQITEKRQYD